MVSRCFYTTLYNILWIQFWRIFFTPPQKPIAKAQIDNEVFRSGPSLYSVSVTVVPMQCAAGVVVSCILPILVTWVRFPVGAKTLLVMLVAKSLPPRQGIKTRPLAWQAGILTSDVLEISAKSEGKRSHGTRDYLRTTGNSRHPSARVPKKDTDTLPRGHGHAATGSLRTPDLGIKEDMWYYQALTAFLP